MSSEKINRIYQVQDSILRRLDGLYPYIEIVNHLGSRHCYRLPNGIFAHVQSMTGEKFYDLVIEYADSEEEMRKYMTEDGDLFPVDDTDVFSDEDALFQAMLEEIRQIGENSND